MTDRNASPGTRSPSPAPSRVPTRSDATAPDESSAGRNGSGRDGQLGKTPPPPWRTEGLPPEPKNETPKPRRNWPALILRGLVVYAIIFGLLTWLDSGNKPHPISYTEFDAQVAAGNVGEVFARGYSIEGQLKEERPLPQAPGGQPSSQLSLKAPAAESYQRFSTERPVFAQDDLMARLEKSGTVVRATPLVAQRGPLMNLLLSFGPLLLLVGFYFWMFRRQQSAMGGMGGVGAMLGGKKREPVDPERVRVTFADVAGIDEVENEISEIVDYLRDPKKYAEIGARAPKGVLLAGGPGTGKTLLARATAGEAGVPFFSASASEFIEMIVGVGASRVRELFESARKVAPAIIFIDEIDTIGRARGGSRAMGGHDEREQTLNQILTEMDGFSGSEGVIVLAATNRADVLDPALLRPGRFDRTITVHAPDGVGRKAILEVHARKVALADDVRLEALARATPGMTGAELANLINEGALLAVKRGQKKIRMADLTDALEKVQLGAARNVVMPPEERRRTAYHEAGHALLGMLQPGADPVRKVSIIPRGRALGVTLSTPDQDRYGYDAGYLRGRMVGALGGMAAEEVVFGVISTGAESDLQHVSGIARSMVGRWGMSQRIGPMAVLPTEGDPRMAGISESTLQAVDEEARRLVEESYARATSLLREHREKLDAIVAELLEHETLDEAAVYAAAGLPRNPEPQPSAVRGTQQVA